MAKILNVTSWWTNIYPNGLVVLRTSQDFPNRIVEGSCQLFFTAEKLWAIVSVPGGQTAWWVRQCPPMTQPNLNIAKDLLAQHMWKCAEQGWKGADIGVDTWHGFERLKAPTVPPRAPLFDPTIVASSQCLTKFAQAAGLHPMEATEEQIEGRIEALRRDAESIYGARITEMEKVVAQAKALQVNTARQKEVAVARVHELARQLESRNGAIGAMVMEIDRLKRKAGEPQDR